MSVGEVDWSSSSSFDINSPIRLLSLSKEDARRIFQNKRVLFAGDESLRILFRDLAQLLEDGHRMADADVNVQDGEYQPMPGRQHTDSFTRTYRFVALSSSLRQGEKRLARAGTVGHWNYFDFRSYCSPSPSTTELYYTYISSLRCRALQQLIDLLESNGNTLSIDLLIFSSFESDMRR